MHKLRWLVLALATMAVLAAAGCGDDDDDGGGGGSAGGEPIKVGASLPLTGEFSEPGKAAQQGYKVWESMVNDSGGLIDGRPVKMVIKDDQSNQNTIVADYNALISRDKVELLADQRPKTAAYPTLDDPFAQPTSEGIEKIFSKAGIKTVYRETYTIDNPNLDGIASALKARKPDVVVHGATFEDGVGMVRALRKAGFTPKILYQTTAPSLGDQYAKAVGKGTTEGIFYGVSHSKEAKTPGNEEFVAKYQG